MESISKRNNVVRLSSSTTVLCLLSVMSILSIVLNLTYVNGLEVFGKDESPFDISYDIWITKWWSWWIDLTTEEATPVSDGCLINRIDSMVMLMETTVQGRQKCDITSQEGIMIPMWTGFYENNNDTSDDDFPIDELSTKAKEQVNNGAITSSVKVDGTTIAKLDVVNSGSVYKINSISNVTEIFSKGFEITIPSGTHMGDEQVVGTWPAGAHGWYVFLKPLSTGIHDVYYDVSVGGKGVNPNSAEIVYTFNVK